MRYCFGRIGPLAPNYGLMRGNGLRTFLRSCAVRCLSSVRQGRRFGGWLGSLLLVLVGVPCVSSGECRTCASVQSSLCHQGGCDEIWEVSTRCLGPCPCDAMMRTANLEFRGCEDAVGWVCKSMDEFFANHDPCVITVVFVHGNRMNRQSVRERGLSWYRDLSRCGACRPPIRLVIWSWISDPIKPITQDVRVKAARTPTQSFLLAQFLSELDVGPKVSLMGHSYGARVIGGALHMLGGGQLRGRSLPTGSWCTRRRLRVVMWAAAFENSWLLPGNFFGCALRVVDQLLITCNRKDPVLKRYWRLDGQRNSQALGQVGLPGMSRRKCSWANVRQVYVTHSVGRRHQWQKYADEPEIRRCTCRNALWQ